MRTSLVLDDELINQALNITGIHNKRELINLALKELIQHRQKKDLFELAGQIERNESLTTTSTDLKSLLANLTSGLTEDDLKRSPELAQEISAWDI